MWDTLNVKISCYVIPKIFSSIGTLHRDYTSEIDGIVGFLYDIKFLRVNVCKSKDQKTMMFVTRFIVKTY